MGKVTKESQNNPNELFPVVGIGASAGGLEAFTQLLSHLSTETGMAFVLIQHLEPHHQSLLTELLSRVTQMPISQVQDGMAVEPNRVYVIPPNTQMTLAEGVLHLAPRELTQGKYMPIDTFFRSLADDRGSRAIAVVLSGTDGDGAMGLEAIKAAGGITFAQCEATAQFSGMPNTAIATGNVDFILPPTAIAEELATISCHPYVAPQTPAETVENEGRMNWSGDWNPNQIDFGESSMSALFALLQTTTGVNFTHYKRTTLERRIRRRMVLYKLERLEDYIQHLQHHPAEVQALYQDILISVTSLFRDPEAFAALKEQVFPQIVPESSAESQIRIWVAGCATGEEVYSIAMCLLEFLAERAIKPPIQIFGTDISESVIDKARTGIYQESLMAGVSPERQRRFFVPVEGGYQISKLVRELCVFAKQNLGSDPPFSSLDLISCRNVLIYLAAPLQRRVLPILHYSLKPTGFLLLGGSESPGASSDLFAVVDKKHRIYARTSVSPRPSFDFAPSNYPSAAAKLDRRRNETVPGGLNVQQQADQIVLHRYAPVGVLINDGLDILQFRGETNAYLRPAPGEPSFNLLKMARPGLLSELRTAIYQAKRQDVPVQKAPVRVKGNESLGEVKIEVIPFKALPAQERYFLVLFEPIPRLESDAEAERKTDTGNAELSASEVNRLRQELADTKRELADTQVSLQATIEEQNVTNQNLTTANEEVLSSNEELQSTNEELQTAKEEIQSANEELRTTNEELHSRNLEARQVNNDLVNLLTNVNIPIMMLEGDLTIRRFTPIAQRLFNLIPSDVGRSLGDIRSNLNAPDLEAWIAAVIDTLNAQEHEVQDREGHWYVLRIRPYRTTDNQIDGVVLALVDINALKQSAARLEAARNYAESIVETVRQPLVVLDADLHVNTANPAFYQTFQVPPDQTEQQLLFELGNGQWNIPQMRSLLEEMLPNRSQVEDFEMEHDFEQIGHKIMLLSAREMSPADDERMILLAIEDITARKQGEAERERLLLSEQEARAEAEAATASKDEFMSVLAHELRSPLNAIQGWAQFLQRGTQNEATTTRALETIERNAKLQSQLIEDLLDITRIVEGKLRIELRPLDLSVVIQAAINTVQLAADEKQIQLESMLAPCPGTVAADPIRMQQVIWNLLTNAIKFTPKGGRVEVRLACSPSHAEVQVIDTGKGISPDFLPYVFERFRQAESNRTSSRPGLGLGLAIVQFLVELHGGTVVADSPGEGQGATFTMRLPLTTIPSGRNPDSGDAESSPDSTGTH